MKVFSGMYLAKSDEQILFLGMYFVESGYGEFWNVDKKNLIYSYFLFQNFRVFLKTERRDLNLVGMAGLRLYLLM